MKSRTLWFLAGTTAGLYTSVKARRVAYRLTPSGLADQLGALGVGMRAFSDEVRAGMAERETRFADELGLTPLVSASPRERLPAHRTEPAQKDVH